MISYRLGAHDAQRWEKYLIYGSILSLAVLIILITLLASAPPISRDALTHHLFVPKLYLQHGGIYEIPNIPFSYYPMNLDLLYMVPLYFGNDILPKYIHFSFALLTVLLIYGYLKNRLGILYAMLGSIFFLSIPIIIKLSITVYVDLGLIFFSTAALLLLLRWVEERYRLGFLLLSGICCGMAAGIKYNGLITIFLLTLFVPLLYLRSENNDKRSNTKAVIYGIIFITTTFTAFSPWLIRNYAWTGNPIYPLHDSLFQSIRSDKNLVDKEKTKDSLSTTFKDITARGSGVFVTRKHLYGEKWWQTLLLPIRFFYEGQDDDPKYFDGKLSPFLLILPVFTFLKKPKKKKVRREQYAMLFFALLLFFLTFFQEAMRIRYIAPIIPVMVILSMYGLNNLYLVVLSRPYFQTKWSTRISLLAVLIPITTMLAYNGLYIAKQFQIVQPMSYLKGEVSRDDYITKHRPEYPAIQFASQFLHRDSKVLCLFLGNRGYYMDFEPIFDNPFKSVTHSLLRQLLTDNNISLNSELRRMGITHILLRYDLTQTWFRQLDPSAQKTISLFFQRNTREIYGEKGYAFLEITSGQ